MRIIFLLEELLADRGLHGLRWHLLDAAPRKFAQLKRPERCPDEAVHLQPQMLADALHLAVLALADGDGEPGGRK